MQVCDGEMGEKEKWNSLSLVKRGGIGDSRVGKSSLMSVACADIAGYGEVPDCADTEGHVWVHGLAAVQVNAHGLYYQRPCGCP